MELNRLGGIAGHGQKAQASALAAGFVLAAQLGFVGRLDFFLRHALQGIQPVAHARGPAGRSDTTIQVNVTLAYFNSSSTKMLFSLFEILNNAVLSGNVVVLNWFYDEDDDTILEFGEEIADDFAALEFRPQALV